MRNNAQYANTWAYKKQQTDTFLSTFAVKVLDLKAQGLSIKEIVHRLNTTRRKIDYQIRVARIQLEAGNSYELVFKYISKAPNLFFNSKYINDLYERAE